MSVVAGRRCQCSLFPLNRAAKVFQLPLDTNSAQVDSIDTVEIESSRIDLDSSTHSATTSGSTYSADTNATSSSDDQTKGCVSPISSAPTEDIPERSPNASGKRGSKSTPPTAPKTLKGKRPPTTSEAIVTAPAVPPTTSKAPGTAKPANYPVCPLCPKHPKNMLDHVRDHHDRGRPLSDADCSRLGFARCSRCRAVCANALGLSQHLSRCKLTTATQPPPDDIDDSGPDLDSDATSVPTTVPTTTTTASPNLLDPSDWCSSFTPQSSMLIPTFKSIPKALLNRYWDACGRTAQAMLDSNFSEASVVALWLLPRVGLAKWAGADFVKTAKDILAAYPRISPSTLEALLAECSVPTPTPSVQRSAATIRIMKEHIKLGLPGKAIRVLMSDGLADVDDECIEVLERLHPTPLLVTEPFGGATPGVSPPQLTLPAFQSALSSLPRGVAAGPSGWTYEMTKGATGQSPVFTNALHGLVQRLLAGSTVATSWITASRLIPLNKRKGGIRPIAAGDTFCRLTCRIAISTLVIDEMLLPNQFGVGSVGGVEAVIDFLEDRAVTCGGIGFIDFENAFNSVNRHTLAEAVRRFCPQLFPLIKNLYGSPTASLVRRRDGSYESIACKEGVRQGDPFASLGFSLVMRLLLEDMAARRTHTASPTPTPAPADPESLVVPLPNTQQVAYLDDLACVCDDASDFDAVLAFLTLPTTTARYGLRVNTSKTRFVASSELASTGVATLGGWVGGPCNETGLASQLVVDEVQRFRSRLPLLQRLTVQEQLCLIRYCLVPTTGHLLRTLHPVVSRRGALEFDSAVSEALGALCGNAFTSVSHATPTSDAALQLPIRLGGVGLTSHVTLAGWAHTASRILSQSVLRERGLGSDLQSDHGVRYDQLCIAASIALDCDPDVLRSAQPTILRHLQRTLLEVVHEENWFTLFNSLPDSSRTLLLDNSGRIGRRWLGLIPTSAATTLPDDVVRFGLRTTMLTPLAETRASTGTCLCGKESNAFHYLACDRSSNIRTNRHNRVRDALQPALRRIFGSCEPEVTLNGGIRADLVVQPTSGARQLAIDVTVVAPTLPEHGVTWPTHSGPRPVPLPTDFSGLTRLAAPTPTPTRSPTTPLDSDGPVEALAAQLPRSPRVTAIRMYRTACLASTVGSVTAAASTLKRRHYAPVSESYDIVPWAITAHGHVGAEATALLDLCSATIIAQRLGPTAATALDHALDHVSCILLQGRKRLAGNAQALLSGQGSDPAATDGPGDGSVRHP